MKKGKKNKEVEKSIQMEVTLVLVIGIQIDKCTYASVLAQTKEVSISDETLMKWT